MLSSKSFKVIFVVAFHLILNVNSIEGYSYGLESMSSHEDDTLSESEVSKVLSDPYERERLSLSVDQIFCERPQKVPLCPQMGHIYDPITKTCSSPNQQGHCADNMIFLPVPNAKGLGACACKASGCWGRPQVLANDNQCYGIATQSPCDHGETVVPISKFQTECRPDVCLHRKPENAINFSEGSKQYPEKYPVFQFTYNGSCYKTESQGFCARGKIVRFVVPFKIPICVDQHEVRCAGAGPNGSGYALQATKYLGCKAGTIFVPSTGKCQPESGFDFT